MSQQEEPQVVTIFGFGSLMDVTSAHKTMPSARNFRKGILRNHRRVYSLVSIGRIRSGKANLESKEMAALAARPSPDSSSVIKGVLFDIPKEEFPAYMEREHRYNIEKRPVLQLERVSSGSPDEENMSGSGDIVFAITCLEQSDEQYLERIGAEEWESRVGRYYSEGRVWGRQDVRPIPQYMTNVIAAASTLGVEWLEDAVDNTYLVDGVTSLRTYVQHIIGHDNELSALQEACHETEVEIDGESLTLLEYITRKK